MGLYELVGYRRRWQILSTLRRSRPSSIAPIVIGGSGGSGTTLLCAALDAHPEICCQLESTVFLKRVSSQVTLARRLGVPADLIDDLLRECRTQVEFVDAFARAVLQRAGKSIWGDKTPENVGRIGYIFRHFPGARFVHVIRDGRDVACSLRYSPWMKLSDTVRGTPEGLRRSARYWATRVQAGLAQRNDARYIEVRYEDLVRDPESTLRRLLDFLEVPWSPAVLDRGHAGGGPAMAASNGLAEAIGPIYLSSIGRWQTDCSAEEIDMLQAELAPQLATLGYLPDRAAPYLQLLQGGQKSIPGTGGREAVPTPLSKSAVGD